MPILPIPGTADHHYYLLCYDDKSKERQDKEGIGGLLSKKIVEDLKADPDITDVFFMSHGWLGDIDAARAQYDAWAGEMAKYWQVRFPTGAGFPYKPLVIGFHWPSKPLGREELALRRAALAQRATGKGAAKQMMKLTSPVGTDESQEAIDELLSQLDNLETISPEAIEHIASALYLEPQLTATRKPRAVTDPGRNLLHIFESIADISRERAREALKVVGDFLQKQASFNRGRGIPVPDLVMQFICLSSFFCKKELAHSIGSTKARELLAAMCEATDKKVRFHLMGHSFGTIVCSAAVGADKPLPRKVTSLALLQGALSFWSFCRDIPNPPGPGRYHAILEDGRVDGPIITTQSKCDQAVGVSYPLVTKALDPTRFGAWHFTEPYGALGAFGARGFGITTTDIRVPKAKAGQYQVFDFKPGQIYNLECSDVICDGDEPGTGAHSDIVKLELANAVWQAAFCQVK